jgi:hypothetical protein
MGSTTPGLEPGMENRHPFHWNMEIELAPLSTRIGFFQGESGMIGERAAEGKGGL